MCLLSLQKIPLQLFVLAKGVNVYTLGRFRLVIGNTNDNVQYQRRLSDCVIWALVCLLLGVGKGPLFCFQDKMDVTWTQVRDSLLCAFFFRREKLIAAKAWIRSNMKSIYLALSTLSLSASTFRQLIWDP